MAKVEYRSIRKAFGDNTVIPDFNLSVNSGEFVILVGPSGCGKSTLLRMLAGFETPTAGEIFIGDRNVTHADPKSRDIGMVFQSYALYPHMTIKENLAFPLKMMRLRATEISERIDEVATMLDLKPLLERKPFQLSGGQKQRVAMGRALVRRPQVLLFDEPLSNLDAQLRSRVRAEIATLHKKIQSTIIYVTHDQVEAMTLADRIAVLNRGYLEQFAQPMDIYRRPKTRFVASFIGTPPMNFLSTNDHQAVGFRPEVTTLRPQGGSQEGQRAFGVGQVSLIEPLGGIGHVHVRLGVDTIIAETKNFADFQIDQNVQVSADESALFYFNSDGTRLDL